MCIDITQNEPPIVSLTRILQNKQIGPDIFSMVIKAPKIALRATPGQFIHIRCSKALSPLLRRPISIASIDEKQGNLQIIYRVVGVGTKLLSQKPEGDMVDIMGPLGKGFPLPEKGKAPILIGGGIGVAPLLFLAQGIAEAKLAEGGTAFMGFAKKEEVYGIEFLESLGFDVFITTDDGSLGIKGFPTDLLTKVEDGIIYGCEPKPLLKKIKDEAVREKMLAYLSLEEHMACGIGACIGCSVKSSGNGYKKVCKDGPVFESREIDFAFGEGD